MVKKKAQHPKYCWNNLAKGRRAMKNIYRVANWSVYNRALKDRYRIFLTVSEEVFENWYAKPTGKRGAPEKFSDIAIQFALTIRVVFDLPLRGCEGVVRHIVEPLGLETPEYTTLCRRAKFLTIETPKIHKGESIFIAVDGSGLKVFGEGEWKVRMHGVGKRRTWRKLHIAVDVATGIIVKSALTTADVHDSEMLPELLEGLEGKVKAVAGDGAYDTWDDYEAIDSIGANAIIPPRRGARLRERGKENESIKMRNETVEYVRKHGSKKWKEDSGYHGRSLSENSFYRIKTIFGDGLRSRLFENQASEAFLKVSALNRMTELGMPESYAAAG